MASVPSPPLCSMTGFGRGRASNPTVSVEVELRSVNGRGLNLKLRLPSERMELESKVEALLRTRLVRGSVQGQIRLRLHEGRASQLDREVVARYLRQWRALEKDLGLEQRMPNLGELLALPGTVEHAPEPTRIAQAVRRGVLEATGIAVEALVENRRKESERQRRELRALLDRLARQLDRVERRLPAALAEAAERLRERVRAALAAAGETDPMDLSRELAVLAERADVREEVARLGIHIQRVRAVLDRGGACGRELEFLIQECHREVTTLGNKSADLKLSERVVAMKLLVAQLKEQVANVE